MLSASASEDGCPRFSATARSTAKAPSRTSGGDIGGAVRALPSRSPIPNEKNKSNKITPADSALKEFIFMASLLSCSILTPEKRIRQMKERLQGTPYEL